MPSGSMVALNMVVGMEPSRAPLIKPTVKLPRLGPPPSGLATFYPKHSPCSRPNVAVSGSTFASQTLPPCVCFAHSVLATRNFVSLSPQPPALILSLRDQILPIPRTPELRCLLHQTSSTHLLKVASLPLNSMSDRQGC